MGYLYDVIALSPVFKTHRLNYAHLAKILQSAPYLLDLLFKSDPHCEWKIAAMCGMDQLLIELLKNNVLVIRDLYGRGVLEYLALGGQLNCLKRWIAKIKDFTPEKDDPTYQLPIYAALGGNTQVLQYLRNDLHYDMTRIFKATNEEQFDETLLTHAVASGNADTVKFLRDAGAPENVGLNLAYTAAENGHWQLFEEYRNLANPIASAEDAKPFVVYAFKRGSLVLALNLIQEYNLVIDDVLKDRLIKGGKPDIFKHFIKEKWLSYHEKFANNASLAHLLAEAGHIDLLQITLEHIDPYAVDDDGKSILHYAAAGGNWTLFEYLIEKYFLGRELPVDKFGNTVAHSAARSGAVWFLMRLNNVYPGLIQQLNYDRRSILHEAMVCADTGYLKFIITEFKLDPHATDATGQNPVHTLAINAFSVPHYWKAVAFMVHEYGTDLLDIPAPLEDITFTIRFLIEKGRAENYFDPDDLSTCSTSNFHL